MSEGVRGVNGGGVTATRVYDPWVAGASPAGAPAGDAPSGDASSGHASPGDKGAYVEPVACGRYRSGIAEVVSIRGALALVRSVSRLRIAALLGCVFAIGFLSAASACLGASGILARGARAAGLGGVRVVGGGPSPFIVASHPPAGLLLEVSWANPYGVSGLDVGWMGVRYGRGRASPAAFVGILQTPTPFREVHLRGSVSVRAADGIVVGGGAGVVSLRDNRGDFANETSIALGAAIAGSRWLEVGCVVETPVGPAGQGGSPKAGSGQAAFIWGFGFPAVHGVAFVLEEERRGGWVSRKVGGEITWPGVIAVRAGVSDSPFTVSLGVGVFRGRTQLDMALVQHEALGTTPHASITYRTSSFDKPRRDSGK